MHWMALAAALLAWMCGAAWAQPPAVSTAPAFSLQDYVSRALASSPELAQAEESLREADYQWKSQTAAAWLPTLSFTGLAYPYGHNPADQYRYVRWRMNRSDMAFNTTVGLNLFNSFQDANRVALARHGRNASRYARDAARRDRSIAAARAYFDLGLRERLVEVARENLKGQEDQYRLTQDLYKNGMKSLFDLLKSETDWRSSELRITFADAERRRSLASFNSLIARDPEAPARLDPLPEPATHALRPLADDLSSAEANRPEALRADALEARADVARRQARRELLPLLSVDATWNHQDTPTFGQPITTLTSIPNPNYQLGVRLSLPSRFNGVSQAADWAAASAARRRAAAERRAVQRQVRLEAVQARISLEQALAAARIAAQKADLAGRNLELVTEQYRQGSADSIRLGQAQLDNLQANTERGQAAHDAAVSLLEYRRAIGEEPRP
ncbi:MAG: TolC family protein [Elusimicrobia bacterium]|nr:TolC family protein [Elusimicrobiota bacterium]